MRRRIQLALAACLLPLLPVQASEEVYRQVAPATAIVYQGPRAAASGTGFLIDADERLLLTARHVVENPGGGLSSAVHVIFAQLRGDQVIGESSHYRKNWQLLALPAKVVYDSIRRDMAILQVAKLPDGIKPLPLASERARPGQQIHVVGNSTDRFGAVFSYCHGHVRNAFHWDQIGANVVSTQAPLNKGDSGGPMVNNRGEVVGFAIMSTTGGPATGVFHEVQVTELSICVTEIRQALEELRRRRQGGPTQGAFTLSEVSPSLHLVTMEKDHVYRIRVQASGFVPDVRLDNMIITPPATPQRPPGPELVQLFNARETKQYRLQVGAVPGRDLAQGPLPYTLNVDLVNFATEETVKESPLQLNEHARRFEAGKVYDITIVGKGFEPDVQVLSGSRALGSRLNDGRKGTADAAQRLFEAVGLARSDFETTLRLVPEKSADYRLQIAVSPYSPPRTAPLDYTVHVAEPKLDLYVSDRLGAGDPLFPQSGPHKLHPVRLTAGKIYQVDLVTTAFDSRLALQDAAGQIIAVGVDAEGYNGRLIFRPTRTDTYRVVATSHQPDARGAYVIAVAENLTVQPAAPTAPGKKR